MNNIQFRIEGDHAEKTSAALKQFLAEEWELEAQTVTKNALPTDTKVEPGTILGAIGIVLAIPSFLE